MTLQAFHSGCIRYFHEALNLLKIYKDVGQIMSNIVEFQQKNRAGSRGYCVPILNIFLSWIFVWAQLQLFERHLLALKLFLFDEVH